jgi:plasmid stabilization system protein ParE
MLIEFEPAAKFELNEALDWYAQRSDFAATAFADEINSATVRIAADPERFPKTIAGCRQASLRRYPYSIIYFIEFSKIFIVAVAHAKRHPEYWLNRRP